VVQSKRAAAVKAGAEQVTWREAGLFMAARRERQQAASAGLDKGLASSQQARELDRQAGAAYQSGDYHKALALLGEVRTLDPSLPVLADHLQRVHQAQREAVAKTVAPRDIGQLADTFGQRLGQQAGDEHERDRNRQEPDGKCQAPQADCPEAGHPYAAGRRCDEHRPKPADLPEPEWAPPAATSSLAAYKPAHTGYRDLSHSAEPEHPNPDHMCVLPDREPGR
jgi:hypothetical protein